MVNAKSKRTLSLGLCAMPPQSARESRAVLYTVLSGLLSDPPTPAQLISALVQLDAWPESKEIEIAGVDELRNAISRAINAESVLDQVWKEFSWQIEINGRASASAQGLVASEHCPDLLREAVKGEPCRYEQEKPCPFGDYYCVDQIGGPCDHLGSGLKQAAKLWTTFARARNPRSVKQAESRCRHFHLEHGRTWVRRLNDILSERAETDLYRVVTMMVDLLILDESEMFGIEADSKVKAATRKADTC